MRTIERHLLAHLGRSVFLTLAAGVALFSIFDLMKNAEAAVAGGGGLDAILSYAALRAPTVAAFLFPFAVFIGAGAAFLAIARRSEFVVLRAAGLSIAGLARPFALFALALAAVHLALNGFAAPAAERALAMRNDAVEETRAFGPSFGDDAWIMRDDVVIRARAVDAAEKALSDPLILRLDETGAIREVVWAQKARAADGNRRGTAWRLETARHFLVPRDAPLEERSTDALLIDDLPAFERFLLAKAPPAQLATPKLWAQALDATNSVIDESIYRTLAQHRLAEGAFSAIMLLLAANILYTHNRRNDLMRESAALFAAAAAFLVLDRLLSSFAAAGSLSAWLGAWGALALAGPLALIALHRRERAA
ncbi:LptF/LptG family permease [Amphiplicatus metriothermophilus]|uniref:LPS export ABC transporter permease LptG n=1 Tax=Amphiplicatus metriothermophilus TaxID=1519374 RepID=A0A239PTD4_9PROT|nr:LptF/LptG family permease [Amphiplicatus metriothermophilus]MBB5519234.1 lipopolysaccharide export system permease protein [Amphiplicatus metriothermophilus]SNT73303.1 LPS export ABC transporter permease LptG [Amphiplicatus metriothermophilus]